MTYFRTELNLLQINSISVVAVYHSRRVDKTIKSTLCGCNPIKNKMNFGRCTDIILTPASVVDFAIIEISSPARSKQAVEGRVA